MIAKQIIRPRCFIVTYCHCAELLQCRLSVNRITSPRLECERIRYLIGHPQQTSDPGLVIGIRMQRLKDTRVTSRQLARFGDKLLMLAKRLEPCRGLFGSPTPTPKIIGGSTYPIRTALRFT